MAVEVMTRADVTLTAEAGDSDPIAAIAIAGALADFPADELLISTLPVERSHWLEHDIIRRAESSFAIPVTHILAADIDLSEQQLLDASGRAS